MKNNYLALQYKPKQVTLAVILLIIVALFHLTRSINGILNWDLILEYDIIVSPMYIVFTGFFWFSLGLTLGIGLWRRKLWALYGSLILTIIFSLWFWIDKKIFQNSPASIIIPLFINMLMLLFFLLLQRRQIKRYFY